MVLPFFDIPFIGLSITAPLLLPVMFYAFFHPANPWIHLYRGWVLVAAAIWLGMVVAFLANGPWFGAREFKMIEIAYLNRYLFWLTVFLVTAYVAADFGIQRRLPYLLGSAVVVLAGLRCFEGIALGKVGAWTDTIFTTQNTYGILFSTFTPFLFPVFLGRGFLRKLLCAAGLFAVLFACAINGSRGSWICIALALAVFSLLAFVSRPGASLRLVLPVGFAALALVAILAGSTRAREAVLSRFSTFENLEGDKSYMSRRALNRKSWRLVSESPFFGVGPGRFRDVYVPLELPQVFSKEAEQRINTKGSHNSYLSFLAEGGLIGGLPLAFLLAVLAVRGAHSAAALNRAGERWGLGVYASFIGMSVHLWVLSGLTGTHAWFVYGLLAATIVLAARVRAQNSVNPAHPQVVRPRPTFAPGRPVAVGGR
ncbi:MAG: O-antigen ligase family protein [Verrucomicrobia bacterium]|nr:O-antigen ligase family protein [Verrucomicrobiota bacterium]